MLLVHQIHQSFIDEDQSVPCGVHQRKSRSRGPNLKINTGLMVLYSPRSIILARRTSRTRL